MASSHITSWQIDGQINGNSGRLKKITDTKGTFHANIGSIKDRNGMSLTEAEEIKKRWQEYTEVYKKVLMIRITTMVWLQI